MVRAVRENALKQKTQDVNDILESELGIPERGDTRDPLSSLIRTILSQNTTDANSGQAYATLRERYPTWEQVLSASEQQVVDAIRVGGLANQKGATIKRLLKWLSEDRGALNLDHICDLPTHEAVEMLSQIKGIGIKTILVMLCFACEQDVFPVDTHILRVTKRLGLVPENASAERAHAVMGDLFPRGKAFPFHMNIIRFGRTVCHARKPQCDRCPVIDQCVAWPELRATGQAGVSR